MGTVYLGIGSNLGDREVNLKGALDALSGQVEIEKISSIYETEPVGYAEQPWFLNLVCRGETGMEPLDLLSLAKRIEAQMGRQESFRNAPRPVDIDIIFFDDRMIETEGLIVPHPRVGERGFVLIPLAQIAPELIHPGNGKSIKNLLSKLEGSEQVREWGNVSSIG